jgi:hypothetical protein
MVAYLLLLIVIKIEEHKPTRPVSDLMELEVQKGIYFGLWLLV